MHLQFLLVQLPHEQRDGLCTDAVAHVHDHRHKERELNIAREGRLEIMTYEHHDDAGDHREEYPGGPPPDLVTRSGLRDLQLLHGSASTYSEAGR